MKKEELRKVATLIASGDSAEAIEKIKTLDLNVNIEGRSILGYAVSYANFEVARYVLDNGANPNGIDTERFTPLMIAAERGDLELIQILIAKGADVNRKNSQNVVALWKSASLDNVEASKLLVEAGANPFAIIAGGANIYEVCKQMGKNNVVDYFDSLKK